MDESGYRPDEPPGAADSKQGEGASREGASETASTSAVADFGSRYQLGPMLGRGGTCSVYRAWDTRLQRHVAIKRLRLPKSEDPHSRARFDREGRAIARLSHPNLVTLIDRGSTEEEEYLVFEYCEGRSLRDLIRSSAPLEPDQAGEVIGQVAEGLAHAHMAGIIHRDVKPQNILLDAEGRVKLTDFGIATGTDWTQVTRAGTIIGSGRYMSPEQVRSRPVDARSDIYSLGVVFYELLMGRPPFDAESLSDIGRKHLKERPPPLRHARPEIPQAVDRVVMRCLEKLPEARFQSMEELLGALVGLDLYQPSRTGGSFLGAFWRGTARKDSLGNSGEWGSGKRIEPEGPARRRVYAERARRHDTRRRLALFVPLAAGIAVVAFLLILLLSGGTATPDLSGKTLDQASSAAEALGFAVEVRAQVPSLDRPAGVVVSQSPQAGDQLEGVVALTVTRKPEPVSVASVSDDDPPPGDGKERSDLLPQLTDGDYETYWVTETYKSQLGSLKKGVGVDFRLEEEALLLEVVSPDEGWAAELQGGDANKGWVRVADLRGTSRQVLILPQGTKSGRIWITRLAPAEGDRYQLRLAEIRFYR